MENETIEVAPRKEQKITTPQAILLVGVLIVVAIFLSKGQIVKKEPKTLSEQVGVSKEELTACIATYSDQGIATLRENIQKSVLNAMSGLPENERGTPYSIVIGKNNVMTQIRGAESYVNAKKIIDEAANGKVTTPYTGKVALSEPTDHIMGNKDAQITVIEYSDFECPYCKRFHPTMEKIVAESNGSIKWVYRQFPLHQHSFEKLVAAECIGKLKGDGAYFKYADLLFGLLKTADDSISDQL